jgi:hypothetical protein
VPEGTREYKKVLRGLPGRGLPALSDRYSGGTEVYGIPVFRRKRPERNFVPHNTGCDINIDMIMVVPA